MVNVNHAFAGLSADDLEAAARFYRDVLGADVSENPNGLDVRIGGQHVFVYPKDDHVPATYTALYLEVPDVDDALEELAATGIEPERYEGMHQDEKGVTRGRAAGMGPDIAWITDPAGNIVALLTE